MEHHRNKELPVEAKELIKEKEEQLHETQLNFEIIIENMIEGILVLDINRQVIFSNPSARKILQFINQGDVGYYLNSIVSNGEIEIDLRQTNKTIIARTTHIQWDRLPAYLVTLHDITTLTNSMKRIRILLNRLVNAQEKERREIGQELHDVIGGALTGIKLSIYSLFKKSGMETSGDYQQINKLIQEAMDLTSNLSQDMKPDILREFGLVEALNTYFERYKKQTKIMVNFTGYKLKERYGDIVDITSYRIIQEALTNVARYAKVDKVDVSIWEEQRSLKLLIKDEGCGFNLGELQQSSSGISGMQDRAVLAGGSLTVDSTPGNGTRVYCTLPLNDQGGFLQHNT